MLKMLAGFAVIYATLYFCGYSLKVLLLRGGLRKFDLYITPWLGLCVIVAALFPLSWMGYSAASVSGYFMAAAALANAAAWVKYRERPRVEAGEAAVLITAAVVAAAVYAVPLYSGGGDRLAVTTSFDIGLYLNCVKSALAFGAGEMSPAAVGIPMAQPLWYILNTQLRGGVFVYALFCSLFGLEPIDVMYAVSAFVMFLNASVLRVFVSGERGALKALPVILIFLLNTFYQNFVSLAFAGQLFSFGLTALAFYLEYYLSEREQFDPRACAALVLVLTANALCWIEGLAFPLLPAFALSAALLPRKGPGRKYPAMNMAFSAALFCAVSFKLIALFVSFFFVIDAQSQAWAMNFPTFLDIAGLQAVFAGHGSAFLAALVAVNAAAVLCLARQVKSEGTASFISLSFFVYLALHVAFCLRYFALGEIQSYNVFKSALSLSFIVWVLAIRQWDACADKILPALESPARGSVTLKLALPTLALLACLSLNAAGTASNWGGEKNWERVISRDIKLIEAYAKSAAYGQSDFIISSGYALHAMAAEYFAPLGRTYAAFYSDLATNPAVLMKDSVKEGDIYITVPVTERSLATTNAPALASNGTYSVHAITGDAVILSGTSGLNGDLAQYRLRGESFDAREVTDETVVMEYMALSGGRRNFSYEFFGTGSGGEFSVSAYLNGEPAGVFESSGQSLEIRLGGAMINPGKNALKLVFGGDASGVLLVRSSVE